MNCGAGDGTVYTGVGSEKNGDIINTETWAAATVPNKDDITNIYAIAHQAKADPTVSCPTTCGPSQVSCTDGVGTCTCTDTACMSDACKKDINQIFVGFERVVNNGDTHVDLEFLQADVELVPNQTGNTAFCAGTFSGHRTQGDLLLSVEFQMGGGVGLPVLHKWDCGSCTPAAGTNICDPGCEVAKATPPHYVTLTDQPIVNAVSQSFNCTPGTTGCTATGSGAVGCGGWACVDAAGNGPLAQLASSELYEVGIDLAGAGFTGCINTFVPHTRSTKQSSGSADVTVGTLKDFSLIKFNTCRPTTKLTKTVCETGSSTNCGSSITIIAGGSATYTYTERNDNTQDVPLTSPCGITGFTSACCTSAGSDLAAQRSCFVTDDKCSGVTYQSGDTNNNNTLDKGETWTFTCTLSNITAAVTNTALGHGNFNDQDVTFCATPSSPPAHTFCDQDEKASATVLVVKPDTCLIKKVASTSVSYSTTVTYTYAEKNEGTVSLNSPSVNDVECTTNGGSISLQTCGTSRCSSSGPSPCCSGDTTVACMVNHDCSGDANDNGVLDPGETFHFQCTATFSNVAGAKTDTAIAHGCFTAGGVTKDVTISSATAASCGTGGKFVDADESDQKTVTITAPTVSVSGGKASCP